MFNEYSKILGMIDNIIKLNDFLEKPLRYSATSTNELNSSAFIVKINATINGENASISLNGLQGNTCYNSLVAYYNELKQERKLGAIIVINHVLVNLDGLAKLIADRISEN